MQKNKTNRRDGGGVGQQFSDLRPEDYSENGKVLSWRWDGFIVFILICIISWGAPLMRRRWRGQWWFPRRWRWRWTRWTCSNCPENNFYSIRIYIYFHIFCIFWIFVQMWSLSALKTGFAIAGGVVGGSIYILEWCLHISKVYVSCLQVKVRHFIYLLSLGLTWIFTFSITKFENKPTKKVISEVFFYSSFHALCCIALFLIITCISTKGWR